MTNERFRIIDGNPDDIFWDYEFVNWGEFSSPDDRDKFTSVGSCLAVSIYDNEQNRGVLAHLTGMEILDKDFQAQTIVDVMLHRLKTTQEHSSSKLEASLAGGVFYEDLRLVDIDSVVKRLQGLCIPIIGQDIGYGYSRAVLLKRDGNVEVYKNKFRK